MMCPWVTPTVWNQSSLAFQSADNKYLVSAGLFSWPALGGDAWIDRCPRLHLLSHVLWCSLTAVMTFGPPSLLRVDEDLRAG